MALSDDILTNAGNPKKAVTDGTSAEQHSLPDQIAADKYLAGKTAQTAGVLGIRFTKCEPTGITG